MKESMNCAETIDRMNRGVALGMLFCGITYFMQAAEKVIEPGTLNSVLDLGTAIGVVLTMVTTAWACYPVVRMKLSGKLFLNGEPESFVTDAMQMSFRNSWIITILILTLALAFQKFIDGWNIETSFYLILMFGLMTFTASVNFFYLTRSDDLEELEE